jgi:AraC-like DNA-binding protein
MGQGFMEERVLRPGLTLYLMDYVTTVPLVMASESWPAGFGWVFLLSGKVRYSHLSFDHEMDMETGMNRLAFQPGTTGSARLFPGAPIRIVTITMTPELFVQTLDRELQHLPPSLRRAALSPGPGGCYEVNRNTPAIQAALFRLAQAVCPDPVPQLLVEGLVLELIGLQIQQLTGKNQDSRPVPPGEREKIEAAREILVRCMADSPLLVDLARQVGLSPNRLSAGFKQIYGATPFAHLKGVRLNRAQALLQETGMNVTEVALAVGYDSLSHFSRAFFQQFGIRPCRVKARYTR